MIAYLFASLLAEILHLFEESSSKCTQEVFSVCVFAPEKQTFKCQCEMAAQREESNLAPKPAYWCFVIYEYGHSLLVPFKIHFLSSFLRERYRVGLIKSRENTTKYLEAFIQRRQILLARKNQLDLLWSGPVKKTKLHQI